MATYAERYALLGDEIFWQRVYVAMLVAANDIINEAPTTLGHAKRLVWAEAVVRDAIRTARRLIVLRVLLNPAISKESSDNDVQFQVNQILPTLVQLETTGG